MENYSSWLSSDDPALWEETYLNYVTKGKVSIDDYVMDWICARVSLPESTDYSIFTPNRIVDAALINVAIKIETLYQGKTRLVHMKVSTIGELHPGYECIHEPNPENSRFYSVGNPEVDTPNYRIWEEYLFMKLTAEILFEKGGLDAIIETIHRHR